MGDRLLGISKDNRPNIKSGLIILEEYNDYILVLKDNCFCEILQEVDRLSNEEFKRCMKKLRDVGYGPIFDSIGNELEGRRIFCEFKGEPQPLRATGRKQIVMRSKIAVAYISEKESKSGIYIATERFMANK